MSRRVPRWGLPVVLIATALLACPAPAAAAGSVIGARTLDAGEKAAYASVGWPDVEVGGIFGIDSLADVAPRVRFSYGHATRPGGFGVAAGAGLRLQVIAWQGWRMAVLAGPELFLHLDARDHPPAGPGSQNLMGFGLGTPAIVASRTFGDGFTGVVGLHAPLTVHLLPEPTLAVPMFASFGFEAPLLEDLNLFAAAEIGSELYGPGGKPDSELYPRLRVGLSLH